MFNHDAVNASITIMVIVFFALACGLLGTLFLRQRARKQALNDRLLPFVNNSTRKLTTEETTAISEYLDRLEEQQKRIDSHENTPIKAKLTPYGDNVYSLQTTIISLGAPSGNSQNKRHYINGIEVYIEPEWVPFIQDINQVDLIKTQTVMFVIALNGHQLTHFVHPKPQSSSALRQSTKTNVKDNDESVELLRLRKETVAEYNLRPKKKLIESLIISVAFMLFFLSLIASTKIMPWLVSIATILLAFGVWRLLFYTPQQIQYNIHCLRGIPKRWGLFGESDNGQLTNISIGAIDLIYPPHWQPYVGYDLNHKTNIDIYLNRYVVKQGKFLSLHNESVNFPLHHWCKNLVLSFSSLLIIALIFVFIPLKLPIELSKAWIHGASNIHVTTPEQLQQANINVGDYLTVQSSGMCSIPAIYHSNVTYPFMPFDCTKIYWGVSDLPSLPSSEIINNAIALLNTINNQLNASNNRDIHNSLPQSDMAEHVELLRISDLADIVVKTEKLCKDSGDCQRLKNALLVLSKGTTWSALVEKAQAQTLDNTAVLLSPSTAEKLRAQVNTIVSSFFYSQTHWAAQTLYNKPKGGFYISNDDNRKQMINSDAIRTLIQSTSTLETTYDNTAIDQWFELKRLSHYLMDIPFQASGIVVDIKPIENGTTKIVLHSESTLVSFWRYLGACLLAVAMIGTLLHNVLLSIIRIHKNRHRTHQILDYYDRCFAKHIRLKIQQT